MDEIITVCWGPIVPSKLFVPFAPARVTAVFRFCVFHHELDVLHRFNRLGWIAFHGDDVSQEASVHVLYPLLLS
jgi:hypothetical protein